MILIADDSYYFKMWRVYMQIFFSSACSESCSPVIVTNHTFLCDDNVGCFHSDSGGSAVKVLINVKDMDCEVTGWEAASFPVSCLGLYIWYLGGRSCFLCFLVAHTALVIHWWRSFKRLHLNQKLLVAAPPSASSAALILLLLLSLLSPRRVHHSLCHAA